MLFWNVNFNLILYISITTFVSYCYSNVTLFHSNVTLWLLFLKNSLAFFSDSILFSYSNNFLQLIPFLFSASYTVPVLLLTSAILLLARCSNISVLLQHILQRFISPNITKVFIPTPKYKMFLKSFFSYFKYFGTSINKVSCIFFYI